jgi:hypothetical protein
MRQWVCLKVVWHWERVRTAVVRAERICDRHHMERGSRTMLTLRLYLGFAFILTGAALAAYGLASSAMGIAVSGFGASAFGIVLLGSSRDSSHD